MSGLARKQTQQKQSQNRVYQIFMCVARHSDELLTMTIVFSHALQGVCILKEAAAGKQRSGPQDCNAHRIASYSLLEPQLVLPVCAFFEGRPSSSALSPPALAEQSRMILTLVGKHASKLGMPRVRQAGTLAVAQNLAHVPSLCSLSVPSPPHRKAAAYAKGTTHCI